MKDVTLEFRNADFATRPVFPVIHFRFEPTSLELLFKTTVTDKQQRDGLTIDRVKEILDQVLNVSKWEEERDVPLRATELIGDISIRKGT